MSDNQQIKNKILKKRHYSLTNLFFIYLMLIVTFSFVALGTYFIIQKNARYQQEVRQLKTEFPEKQKEELKIRVLEAKEFVDWVSSYPDESLNKQLASLTKRYGSLLESANLPTGEKLILLPERIHDSLDYANQNSVIKIAVFNSQLKPVYIPDLADSTINSGRYRSLISRMIAPAVIKESSLRPDRITHYTNQEKTEYAALYPVNNIDFWILAVFSGNDRQEALKELVLDSLSRVKFHDNEYIIINTMDGDALLTRSTWDKNPKNILTGDDENWKEIFRQEVKLAKTPGGGYITYTWSRRTEEPRSEKISYFTGISQWNWVIGTGKHTNAITPLLEQQKKTLRADIRNDIFSRLIFMTLIYLLIYILGRYISRKLKTNLQLFSTFFSNAAHSSQRIDEESVHFHEFETMARSANLMIEERDKIRTILSEQQSRLRNIIDSVPDMIFFKDTSSRFQGCNKAFERFVNKKESEIIGMTEFDLFTPAQADVYLASDKHLLLTGEPVRTKEWTPLKDGHSLLFDTLKTTYRDDDGNILGIIAISRDVTEMEETRQRLLMAKDKAEESDRLKTAFLANMSHEIRTPMNAIIGFSDLLSDDDITHEEKADFVEKIKLSGENLMNLINDIIDIAKIEAGQLKIIESPCNIDSVMSDLLGTFTEIRNQQKKQAVDLILNIKHAEKEIITVTDQLRLQQVITNLIGNALKFTENGRIEFGFDIEDGFLKFFVKDTGIGIPESKQEILFQRFTQVDASTTRKFGGTGLGLAISKNIVELLGGTIWMESTPGIGSTFYFTIPYKPSDKVNSINKSPAADYDWSEHTIMVAEDIDENYMLIEAAFRRTGVKMVHARDGLAAVNEAKSNDNISLILMDIQLPVMTGYEAIHNILLIKPEIPIISYTAYALPNEREKSLEAGCVDYVTKPMKAEFLLPLVNKYLKPGIHEDYHADGNLT
ncbi:MAG TPA: ATP-binding protein [Bacteroidales bacterium]|jgi:PAS domain S-box-containing protein|nr:ATP-binding protein [Bacteroidales bacterium]